jgi:hypothetical protein
VERERGRRREGERRGREERGRRRGREGERRREEGEERERREREGGRERERSERSRLVDKSKRQASYIPKHLLCNVALSTKTLALNTIPYGANNCERALSEYS